MASLFLFFLFLAISLAKDDPMKLFEGKRLKIKEHLRDWDDSLSIVSHYGMTTKKWLIITDDNFSCWYSEEEADKDFEEL